MIYNCYFQTLSTDRVVKYPVYVMDRYGDPVRPYQFKTPGEKVLVWPGIRKQLESSQDTFCFTVAQGQYDNMLKLIEEYKLEEFIVAQSPKVMNPNYKRPAFGPRIALFVFKGKGKSE